MLIPMTVSSDCHNKHGSYGYSPIKFNDFSTAYIDFSGVRDLKPPDPLFAALRLQQSQIAAGAKDSGKDPAFY